jgi:hypothetical protein
LGKDHWGCFDGVPGNITDDQTKMIAGMVAGSQPIAVVPKDVNLQDGVIELEPRYLVRINPL